MKHMTRCPCCNDIEHIGFPMHDIMMVQTYETSGVVNFMARYYYCPITQELYVDEDLQNEHTNIVKSILGEE